MTLNGVMAVAMRYFIEFGSFPGSLRKSGCRYTDNFCGRIFIVIFAKNYQERVRYAYGRM